MNLQDISNALIKATKKNDPNTLKTLLRNLSTKSLTVADLKATKIGRVVNKLRKHSDPAVAVSSKKLVLKWKNIALGKTPPPPKSRGLPKTQPNGNHKVPPAKVKQKKVVAEEVVSEGDIKISDNLTGNKTRDVVRKKVALALAMDAPAGSTPNKKAVEVENKLWETFGHDNKKYLNRYRDIVPNLKSVKDFRSAVLCGSVSPEELTKMKVEDMSSSKIREERDAAKKWELAARDSDARNKGSQKLTDDYKCEKCGSWECSYYQIQIRGADEPMTTFVTCTKCGERWRDGDH